MTAIRKYKTKRGALAYRDKLRAMWPDKEFGVVPRKFGWAVALFEDGKVRALCS